MYAKKSLGQHFLMHASIAERMVHVSGVTSEDVVLEIGPGRGLLTRVLLAKAKEVIAIETDAELIPVLEETFTTATQSGKLRIVHQDIREFDPKSLTGAYKVVANIPYYITGEILRQFLTTKYKPDSITLLVQKEVAERVTRAKKESLLSLSVKVFGTPTYEFTVPRGAFTPPPSIDSAVLRIDAIRSPFKNTEQEQHFFSILHAGFGHKRKQLGKNIEGVASGEKIASAFQKIGVSPTIRAEDLTLEQWLALTDALS